MGPVSFLTPLAALVALLGLVPLAAAAGRERRGRRVRKALGLPEPPRRGAAAATAALVALPVLAGVAAAQPVLDRSTPVLERSDAELFFVLDTSRSMLAAPGPDEPARFDRARSAAIELRARLAGVPAGVAQVTDWTVPHLFPTVDAATFRATVARSVTVGSPGSQRSGFLATDVNAIADVARGGYFTPGVRKRLLVVLTDGESDPVSPQLVALRDAGVHAVFVHVWGPGESIWRPDGAEPQYSPDPASRQTLDAAAETLDGAVFAADELGAAAAHLRARLGDGPTRRRDRPDRVALMPWLMLAAALPLGAILLARNV